MNIENNQIISTNQKNRVPAWVTFGNEVQSLTWKDAIKGKLDWTVSKKPLQRDGYDLPNTFGIFRDDLDSQKGYLGNVGNGYTVLQNSELFEIMDNIIGEQNGANYSNVGCINGGQKVFAVANLNADFEVVEGDTHKTYLLAMSSHNGSQATEYAIVTIRLICVNGLKAPVKDSSFRVKHTRYGKHRLNKATRQLNTVLQGQKNIKERLITLSKRVMTRETMSEVLDKLFPASKSKASQTRSQNLMMEVIENYEHNDGNAFPEIKGTAYNLLNAVTEWHDHDRAVKSTNAREGMDDDQKRALGTLTSTKNHNLNAMKLIETVTANNQIIERPKVFTVPSQNDSIQSIDKQNDKNQNNSALLDSILNN